MGSYYCEADSPLCIPNPSTSPLFLSKNPKKDNDDYILSVPQEVAEEEEEMGFDCKNGRDDGWPHKSNVPLEEYIDDDDGSGDGGSKGGVGRTKSLTDEDLEKLKGCLDLGFRFNYEEISELCNTLTALELSGEATEQINWRISGPGKIYSFWSQRRIDGERRI